MTGIAVTIAVLLTSSAAASPASLTAAANIADCGRADVAVRYAGHRGCMSAAWLHAAARRPAGRDPLLSLIGGGPVARRLLGDALPDVPGRARALERRTLARITHKRASSAAAPLHRAAVAQAVGVPNGDSLRLTDAGPEQVGTGLGVHGAGSAAIGGQTIDTTVGYSNDRFAQRCPGIAGELPGRLRTTVDSRLEFPQPNRLRAVLSTHATMIGTLTGHTGPDGKLHDFDLAADIDVRVDIRRLGPAGLVHGQPVAQNIHIRLVYVGLPPHPRAADVVSPDHLGLITLASSTGRAQTDFRNGDLIMPREYLSAFGGGIAILLLNGESTLSEAQAVFYDQAACLRAVFDPGTLPPVKPHETVTLATSVQSTVDGREQSIDLDATADHGTVAPARTHAAPGVPARLALIALAADHGRTTLAVAGLSRRGRVAGSITADVVDPPAAYGYQVSFTGSGTYSEDSGYTDASEDIEHHFNTVFNFRSEWGLVVLPAVGMASRVPVWFATAGTLDGIAASSGTEHDSTGASSTYKCTGPLADLSGAQPGALRFAFKETMGHDHAALVTAAPSLGVAVGSGTCSQSGTFFGSPFAAAGGPGLNDLGPALTGTALYSDADIGRQSFTTSVLPTSLADACGLGNDVHGAHCTHGLGWKGDVTFTKVSSCEPAAGGGYACGRL